MSVNRDADRDAAIDRALASVLPGALDRNPSPDCLDADVVAAMVDGSLTREARATAEAHAAGCARCQALLAAMARTATDEPGDARLAPSRIVARLTPSRYFWWLVPAASVAAAIAIFIYVRPAPPAPVEQTAAVSATPPASAVAPSAAKPEQPARDERAANAVQAAPKKQAEPTHEVDRLAKVAPAPANAPAAQAPAPPSELRAEAALKDEARQDVAKERAQIAPPPAPKRLNETVTVAGALAAQTIEIVSPDPSVRWRIVGAGVQRSTDAGATWEAQTTGTSVALAAGASPSATVCWIVGRAGTVLLTADARTWRVVPFPDVTDLTAVRATDAATATVTTADGRALTTLNAGQSWK